MCEDNNNESINSFPGMVSYMRPILYLAFWGSPVDKRPPRTPAPTDPTCKGGWTPEGAAPLRSSAGEELSETEAPLPRVGRVEDATLFKADGTKEQ